MPWPGCRHSWWPVRSPSLAISKGRAAVPASVSSSSGLCLAVQSASHIPLFTTCSLTRTVQGHVKGFERCLLVTGPDTDGCEAGMQLQRLVDQFCCLHSVKVRVDPHGHQIIMGWPNAPNGSEGHALVCKPDWLAIGVRLQLPRTAVTMRLHMTYMAY